MLLVYINILTRNNIAYFMTLFKKIIKLKFLKLIL